ncbi:hypothetical protein M752DRAFT_276397 [Aspergillus phoenicis ATCC 13157]|uniref:Uncharacterized protein n=1 Tax=Aspergillus phoenicis ATCC 13157 TaxID=1353007 RepID=A0A370PK35_ASPPH|nr:hypothetical protein M752DRAFT_276397 [Aspergillus phoenicis ATCC 13157]
MRKDGDLGTISTAHCTTLYITFITISGPELVYARVLMVSSSNLRRKGVVATGISAAL